MPPDLARFAGSLRSREQLLLHGFHSRDLSGPSFTRVLHGYHTPTEHPASLNAMVWVLQKKVLPGSVASHTTAALLHGIPLPWPLEHGVGFLRPCPADAVPGPGSRLALVPSVRPGASLGAGARLPLLHARTADLSAPGSLRGVRIHRMREGPVAARDELLLSSVPEVLRELATMVPVGDVTAAIDSVLAPEQPIAGIGLEEIAAHAEAARGLPGSARLRAAAALARTDVRSYGESILRLLVVGAGFPEPDRNLPVRDSVSDRRRYLDLAWRVAMFALEYDGDGHRTTKEQWRLDEARRDELASCGWTLARATGDDLRHPLRILLRLSRSLGERGLAVPGPDRIRRYVAGLSTRRLSLCVLPRTPEA